MNRSISQMLVCTNCVNVKMYGTLHSGMYYGLTPPHQSAKQNE